MNTIDDYIHTPEEIARFYASFQKFDTGCKLASIASTLIHVVRYTNQSSDTLLLLMLRDAIRYTEQTTGVVSLEAALELVDLRRIITHWKSQ